MVSQFTVHPERITRSLAKGYATATDLADALVLKKGIPFREAHHITGRLVGLCAEKGLTLDEASIELRSSVHEALADESFYREATALETGVERKVSRGGTARFRVMEQLDRAAAELENRKMISVVAPSLDF
jgi:argininosuccinate lyase